MKVRVLIILLGLAIWSSCFKVKVPELIYDRDLSLQENLNVLDEWFKNLQGTGWYNGSVLIAQEGRPLFSKAYGYTDHTQTQLLTTDHAFRLASVSKQFTAAAIMLLQQDELLAYDDRVIDYIPELTWGNVTIRHLLTHTSGLPDYESDSRSWIFENPLTTDQVIQQYRIHRKPLRFDPGVKYEYSNTGYILLAKVVERISGMTFETFVQQRIFNPLGMHRTRVWNLLSSDKTFENKAYGFNGRKPNDFTSLDGVVGDGGIFACAEDFIAWDQAWYDTTLLIQENKREAYRPYTLNDGQPSFYGFGWGLSETGFQVNHSGGWVGARTFMMRDLDKKSLIVILDNSTNQHLDQVWEQFELFLEEGDLINCETATL